MSKFRIGLIGAPGSGKSKLATALCIEAAKTDIHPLRIAHNGGRNIANMGQAVGAHGSFREDYWALFEQLREETIAGSDGNFVSVGTVWESLAHASVNLETLTLGIQTPQVEEEVQLRMGALAMLSLLSLQNFRCNFAYRVPLPKTKPDDVDEFDWLYGKKIDVALTAILDLQGLKLQTLSDSAPRTQALEIIANIQKYEALSE